MTQLHKRFTDGQVKVLLNGYCRGLLVLVCAPELNLARIRAIM